MSLMFLETGFVTPENVLSRGGPKATQTVGAMFLEMAEEET
jgi:hypothetical protein